mmetsp:Transcript_91485/g.257900  ORF Transcript_91485/g.257900 Transcript_91485/m.257900 type:complete len:223 (-) Transcript_91485:75-743(-)
MAGSGQGEVQVAVALHIVHCGRIDLLLQRQIALNFLDGQRREVDEQRVELCGEGALYEIHDAQSAVALASRAHEGSAGVELEEGLARDERMVRKPRILAGVLCDEQLGGRRHQHVVAPRAVAVNARAEGPHATLEPHPLWLRHQRDQGHRSLENGGHRIRDPLKWRFRCRIQHPQRLDGREAARLSTLAGAPREHRGVVQGVLARDVRHGALAFTCRSRHHR